MSEGLKECPFCGDEVELIQVGNEYSKKKEMRIKCKSCNVQMVMGAIKFDFDWLIDKIISKWNKSDGKIRKFKCAYGEGCQDLHREYCVMKVGDEWSVCEYFYCEGNPPRSPSQL